ncbi:MAG TPA: HyaD/HybD family hydrogenase maturation endopeptidase [Acidisarcina sp.]|nr:HyaD/HybD family hydrogenase maturation endopeptidase [Acidisarcina sp.]
MNPINLASQNVVVLALGNLMRTDDAAGMLALTRLAGDERLPAGVRLVEGGTLGLELLYQVEHASLLLVLDAVDAKEPPGTLMLFRGEAVEALPCGQSIHLLGMADLLSALRLTERAPSEVVLIGIQPESTGWGTQLTPTVEASLPRLIEAALDQIAAWQSRTADALASAEACS